MDLFWGEVAMGKSLVGSLDWAL